MNVFISLKLTQRFGFWIDLDLTHWEIKTYNYYSNSSGQCVSYTLGPISMGCNYPNAAGEAELNAKFDVATEQLNRTKEEVHDQKTD